MKLLLAPLLFQQRICAHCKAKYYNTHPGRWLGLWEFESLPPLGSFDPAKGFTPDYASMLMFDEFVIDADAASILRRPAGRGWLGSWPELIEALHSEGALSVVDVRGAAARTPQRRGAMLRRDLRDPSRWSHAMTFYDGVAGRAQALLGPDPEHAKRASWKFDVNRTCSALGGDGHYHSLGVVLGDGPQSDDEAHRAMYEPAKAVLTNHLREVNACLTACETLEVARFMWAPYRGYMYEKMHGMGATGKTMRQATAGLAFFEVAFPAYSPLTVPDFSKLRRDKRIRQLRDEIARAADNGDTLDPHYPQRVLQQVLKIELRLGQIRRINGWITTIAGVIPVPGLGLVASAVGEAIGSFIERRKRAKWRWFYLISDGRGAT